MSWFKQLRSRLGMDDKTAARAEEIAERCFDPVWRRVRGRVLSMSVNESRGYIRARAAAVVRREIDLALRRPQPAGRVSPSKLTALATHAVIRRISTHAHALRVQPAAVRRAA